MDAIYMLLDDAGDYLRAGDNVVIHRMSEDGKYAEVEKVIVIGSVYTPAINNHSYHWVAFRKLKYLKEATKVKQVFDLDKLDIIERTETWQRERLLHKQPFDFLNEATNIIEELAEAYGYRIPKEKRSVLREKVKLFFESLDFQKVNNDETDTVDAFADIIVFSVGAIMKLGYNPECIMRECLQEIESRRGVIIDGKFQKDTSEKAKQLWYTADYKKCKKGE